MPYLRYWLDGDPGSVTTVERGGGRRTRLLLFPRHVRVVRRFYKENFPQARPPATYRELYRNATWKVVAAPGCA